AQGTGRAGRGRRVRLCRPGPAHAGHVLRDLPPGSLPDLVLPVSESTRPGDPARGAAGRGDRVRAAAVGHRDGPVPGTEPVRPRPRPGGPGRRSADRARPGLPPVVLALARGSGPPAAPRPAPGDGRGAAPRSTPDPP